MSNFKRVPKKTLTVIADLVDQLNLFNSDHKVAVGRALKAYPQVWGHLPALTVEALAECGIKPPQGKISASEIT